jgi:hypothetical protein
MSIRTPLLALSLLSGPLYAQDAQFVAAMAEMDHSFREHRFDPSIMVPFHRGKLDPLIVQNEWEGVRRHVEAALNRLNAGIRPISLPCQFRPQGNATLIPVFVFEKGNVRAKTAFKLALGLRDDALWDYEPATGRMTDRKMVTETRTVTTGDFDPKYLKLNGEPNLLKIHMALQDVVSGDDNSLKAYGFQTRPVHIAIGQGMHFTTVWISAGATKFIAHAWRVKIILERAKQADAWEFVVKVEIGKRYASQTDYSIAADSMNGDFSNLTEHMHIRSEKGRIRIFYSEGVQREVDTSVGIPGEPVKAEVPPPIQIVKASAVSPLEGFVNQVGELCRKKLLRSNTKGANP